MKGMSSDPDVSLALGLVSHNVVDSVAVPAVSESLDDSEKQPSCQ
jgi:hypothetical protein